MKRSVLKKGVPSLRLALFEEERQHKIWRKLTILLISLLYLRPGCTKGSSICRHKLREIIRFLCSQAHLYEPELESAGYVTVAQLRHALATHMKGRRCRTYLRGPKGWSGDTYYMTRRMSRDFVGVRIDVLGCYQKGACQFTLRHELQHEIQRYRDHASDEEAMEDYEKRLEWELDANLAAMRYVQAKGLCGFLSPFCYERFVRWNAKIIAAGKVRRSIYLIIWGLSLLGLGVLLGIAAVILIGGPVTVLCVALLAVLLIYKFL